MATVQKYSIKPGVIRVKNLVNPRILETRTFKGLTRSDHGFQIILLYFTTLIWLMKLNELIEN